MLPLVVSLTLTLTLVSQEPAAPPSTPAAAAAAPPAATAPAATAPAATAPAATAPAATAPAATAPAAPAAAAPADAEGGSKVAIVVLDFRADGVEPSLASSMTGLVSSELDDTGVIQVTTEEDVRRLMDMEQMKLMLACTDVPNPEAACLSNFKNALGAKTMITGVVGKAGDQLLVSMTLFDLDKALAVGRETATVRTPAGIVVEVRSVLPRLLQPVLESRSGTLAVLTNEPGATVILDGAAVGPSPWRAERVAAGPHRVEAQRDGFIKSGVDVIVKPTGSTAVQVLLVPSREYADDHRRTATALRIGAFSAAGLAAASLAGGTAVWVYQAQKTAEHVDGAPVDDDGAVLLSAAKYNELQLLRYTQYGLMVAAVPLAVTSIALFIVGDDPGKYDALLEAAPPAPSADAE